MANYSVKQIAEMLDTNPETVRRWIRAGRLESSQASKKEGNVVSEEALKTFLERTPSMQQLRPVWQLPAYYYRQFPL